MWEIKDFNKISDWAFIVNKILLSINDIEEKKLNNKTAEKEKRKLNSPIRIILKHVTDVSLNLSNFKFLLNIIYQQSSYKYEILLVCDNKESEKKLTNSISQYLLLCPQIGEVIRIKFYNCSSKIDESIFSELYNKGKTLVSKLYEYKKVYPLIPIDEGNFSILFNFQVKEIEFNSEELYEYIQIKKMQYLPSILNYSLQVNTALIKEEGISINGSSVKEIYNELIKLNTESISDGLTRLINNLNIELNSTRTDIKLKKVILSLIQKDQINRENCIIVSIVGSYFMTVFRSTQMIVMDLLLEDNLMTMFLTAIMWANTCNSLNELKTKDGIKKIESIIEVSRRYVLGIKELCNNTLVHTNYKSMRNYLSLRVYSDKDFSKYNFLKNEYAISKYIKDSESQNYVEIEVVDYSKNGLLDTNENNRNSLYELFDLNLTHIMDSDQHSLFRFLSRLGLRTFAYLVKDFEGFFAVETNKNSMNDKKIYYCNYEDLKSKVSKRLSGTHYRVILNLDFDGYKMHKPNYLGHSLSETCNESTELDLEIIEYFSSSKPSLFSDWDNMVAFSEEITPYLKKKFNNTTSNIATIDFEYYYSFLKNKISSKFDKTNDIIKILALIRIISNHKYIVVFNVSDAIMHELNSKLIEIFNKMKSTEFWNTYNPLFIYNQDGVPFVLSGNSLEECYLINNKILAYHGITVDSFRHVEYNSLDIDNSSINLTRINENNSNFIARVHDYINFNIEQDGETLFMKTFKRILNTDMFKSVFGVRLKDTHVEVGPNLHLDTFYQAELVFKNAYFSLGLSKLLSKLIYKERSKKTIIVGYEGYSTLLINNLKKGVEDKNDVITSIFNGKNMNFSNADIIYDLLLNANDITDIELFIVVPIAASLSTNIKIMNRFKERFTSVLFDINLVSVNQYAIIMVAPDLKELCKGKYSFIGLDYNNYLGKKGYFSIDVNKTLVNCLIHLNTEWYDPLNCRICKIGIDNSENIRPLIKTSKDNLVPNIKYGLPINKFDMNRIRFTVSTQLLKESISAQNISYQHQVINNFHFLSYFDYSSIIDYHLEDNMSNFEEWSGDISEYLHGGDVKYFDFIISPKRNIESRFVDEVKLNVFKSNAYIECHDYSVENLSNLLTLRAPIIGLICEHGEHVRFHFVDDAIVTGNTYRIAKTFVDSLLIKAKVKRSVTFNSVILFNSRYINNAKFMNKINVRSENLIFSYSTFLVPYIMESLDECHLCNERCIDSLLYQSIRSDIVKSAFMIHLDKLKIKNGDRLLSNINANRRFLLAHLFNMYLSKYEYIDHVEFVDSFVNEKYRNNNLSYFNVEVADLYNEIGYEIYLLDFVKMISLPPYNYYYGFRMIASKIINAEINELINYKDKLDEPKLQKLLFFVKYLVKIKGNLIQNGNDFYKLISKVSCSVEYNKLSEQVVLKLIISIKRISQQSISNSFLIEVELLKQFKENNTFINESKYVDILFKIFMENTYIFDEYLRLKEKAEYNIKNTYNQNIFKRLFTDDGSRQHIYSNEILIKIENITAEFAKYSKNNNLSKFGNKEIQSFIKIFELIFEGRSSTFISSSDRTVSVEERFIESAKCVSNKYEEEPNSEYTYINNKFKNSFVDYDFGQFEKVSDELILVKNGKDYSHIFVSLKMVEEKSKTQHIINNSYFEILIAFKKSTLSFEKIIPILKLYSVFSLKLKSALNDLFETYVLDRLKARSVAVNSVIHSDHNSNKFSIQMAQSISKVSDSINTHLNNVERYFYETKDFDLNITSIRNQKKIVDGNLSELLVFHLLRQSEYGIGNLYMKYYVNDTYDAIPCSPYSLNEHIESNYVKDIDLSILSIFIKYMEHTGRNLSVDVLLHRNIMVIIKKEIFDLIIIEILKNLSINPYFSKGNIFLSVSKGDSSYLRIETFGRPISDDDILVIDSIKERILEKKMYDSGRVHMGYISINAYIEKVTAKKIKINVVKNEDQSNSFVLELPIIYKEENDG